jgi:hypothetical protein
MGLSRLATLWRANKILSSPAHDSNNLISYLAGRRPRHSFLVLRSLGEGGSDGGPLRPLQCNQFLKPTFNVKRPTKRAAQPQPNNAASGESHFCLQFARPIHSGTLCLRFTGCCSSRLSPAIAPGDGGSGINAPQTPGNSCLH